SSDNARWSPDGRWIAYTGVTDPNSGVSTTYVYLVSSAGGPPKQLTSGFDLNAAAPVWSRDARSLYVRANLLDGNEICSADGASGPVTQLSKTGSSINLADISKDGNTVIGTLTRPNAPAEIYKSNLKFTEPVALSSHNQWLSEFTLADTEVVKSKS